MEELLLPSKLEQHRKTFYEHVHKGKHCEVDVFRALSNTSSLFVRYVFPNLDNQISIHNSSFIRDVSTEKITTKPYFVFHIGIPKSGTTTIQCGLTKLSGELASQDSYYYIGKQCAWQGVKHGLKNGETPFDAHTLAARLSQGKMEGILKTLNATLNRHLHRQVGGSTAGIVLSSENMVTYRFQTRQSTFDFLKGLLEGYSVRIVIGYRRYFEWMPSLFYQYNLQEPLAQSYVEYIRRKLNTTTSHMTTDATRKWNAQFEDVYVFNMHQDGDLVTNFVCQALPGPPTHVCRTLLVDTSTNKATNATASYNDTSPNNKNRNVAKDINWLRLVAVARESGWKNTTEEEWERSQSRFEVFQTNHPEEYQSFLSCLTKEEQEQLLNLSLAYEKELVATATATVDKKNKHLGKLLSPSNVEDHRQNFYEHVRKRKYCEMDVYRALSNTNSSFFRFVLPTRQNNRQSPEDNILPSR